MHEGDDQEGEQGTVAPPGHSVSEDDEEFEEIICELGPVDVPFRVFLSGERMGGPDGQRFELIEELGRGAMGQVFHAWDHVLEREVTLKFLQAWIARAGQPSSWPLREARVIAQLDHENIVRFFDVGEWRENVGEGPEDVYVWPEEFSEPSVPFLVMEYLKGESLASLLRRERPGPRRTLEILGAVAAGLEHAHAHGVVHGDLKPSNVFITRAGGVKLLDFGLAHLLSGESSHGSHLPTSGTPPYLAPEQWRGAPWDARVDLWAAGMMLYEMLTGELPYEVFLLQELRDRVLSSELVPSVRELVPELPEELARLVAELLVKEPGRRLGSASVLREMLLSLE